MSMPSPAAPAKYGLRQRQQAEMRMLLCEEALTLFRKNGFDQTTVAAITNRAQVAKGTFFNYFPAKEAVLLAWYRHMTHDALVEARAARRRNPKNAILGLALGLIGRAIDDAELWRAKTYNVHSAPSLREEESKLDKELQHFIIEQFELGCSAEYFDRELDTHLAASVVVALVTEASRAWAMQNDAFDLSALVKKRLNFFLNLCAP